MSMTQVPEQILAQRAGDKEGKEKESVKRSMKSGERGRSEETREAPTPHPSEMGMAYFGYRRVPANEKARWVLRHFNTVAGKYDSMNTLLSFGIHYLWKRSSVHMLGLKPGDWVIDVCGGTGDLSILAAKAVGSSGRVVLCDINQAMMNAGKPKVPERFAGMRPAVGITCLVREDRVEALSSVLEEINDRDGMAVRFTGPWAPFSFVRVSGG